MDCLLKTLRRWSMDPNFLSLFYLVDYRMEFEAGRRVALRGALGKAMQTAGGRAFWSISNGLIGLV